MSLKAFHIVFIVASIFLCIGFGVWSLQMWTTGGDVLDIVIGVISIVCGLLLTGYGIRFLKKLRHVSFI